VDHFDLATKHLNGSALLKDSAFEDTDGDGDLDLILHFRTQETNLANLYAQLVADDINADDVLDSRRQTAAVSLTGRTATDEYFQPRLLCRSLSYPLLRGYSSNNRGSWQRDSGG
jgi:hypothetical protein